MTKPYVAPEMKKSRMGSSKMYWFRVSIPTSERTDACGGLLKNKGKMFGQFNNDPKMFFKIGIDLVVSC